MGGVIRDGGGGTPTAAVSKILIPTSYYIGLQD